jgi:hypothetical protein
MFDRLAQFYETLAETDARNGLKEPAESRPAASSAAKESLV